MPDHEKKTKVFMKVNQKSTMRKQKASNCEGEVGGFGSELGGAGG